MVSFISPSFTLAVNQRSIGGGFVTAHSLLLTLALALALRLSCLAVRGRGTGQQSRATGHALRASEYDRLLFPSRLADGRNVKFLQKFAKKK